MSKFSLVALIVTLSSAAVLLGASVEGYRSTTRSTTRSATSSSTASSTQHDAARSASSVAPAARPVLTRRKAFIASVASIHAGKLIQTLPTLAAVDSSNVSDDDPFANRNRNSNKGAVIREDYWYMVGKKPPRLLDTSLKGDDPQYNAFGSCSSSESGGNSCTYVSLTLRIPAYSKYNFPIRDGAQEYQKMGRLIANALRKNSSDNVVWDQLASFVVKDGTTSYPPPVLDAELKMLLLATALTTSPNFPGPSRELLVARFYINEYHHANQQIAAAVEERNADLALAAWEFGRDSLNSYFRVVNRSIVEKVGEKFEAI